MVDRVPAFGSRWLLRDLHFEMKAERTLPPPRCLLAAVRGSEASAPQAAAKGETAKADGSGGASPPTAELRIVLRLSPVKVALASSELAFLYTLGLEVLPELPDAPPSATSAASRASGDAPSFRRATAGGGALSAAAVPTLSVQALLECAAGLTVRLIDDSEEVIAPLRPHHY